mgnify:CR=1 FL=1
MLQIGISREVKESASGVPACGKNESGKQMSPCKLLSWFNLHKDHAESPVMGAVMKKRSGAPAPNFEKELRSRSIFKGAPLLQSLLS